MSDLYRPKPRSTASYPKQIEPPTMDEFAEALRKCSNAFVMSGYRPKQDSANPCESLLFDAMSMLARWDARHDHIPEAF
jgi:hypothetical protein